MSEWIRELAYLRNAGIILDPGLTGAELSAAEQRCGAPFPPDLRDLLTIALPKGERFPDWRDLESPALEQALMWPFEGIAFDIEHNGFWWQSWGARPRQLMDALDVARQHIAAAPRLIPVYGHRYLPATPAAAGNPVLSVYQTDVIYYGDDLRQYIAVEFGAVGKVPASMRMPRAVPFWSDLIEAVWGHTG